MHMHRHKINLNTFRDCVRFVNAIKGCRCKISLEDGAGYKINAKSLLGALATIEWDNLYCCSEEDIYSLIEHWVILI